MKKNLFFAAIAVAAIAVSCNKSEQPAEKVFTTSFTGEMAEDVKTYLDPETFQVKFNKDEKFMTAAIQGTTYKTSSVKVTSEDGAEPAILGNATYSGLDASAETYYFAGTYVCSGIPSPANLLNQTKKYTEYKIYTNQKITTNGPRCVGKDGSNNIEGMPMLYLYSFTETYDAPQTKVSFKFHHVSAYGNIIVKNLGLSEGDKISTINISTKTRSLASRIRVNLDGTVSISSEITKYLNLDVTEMNINSGNFNVVFAITPLDCSSQTFEITITTQNGDKFVKSVNSGSKGGKFQIGHILPFNVDFTGVEAK